MGLCEVCRKIDIRKLLQTAVSLDHIKGHVNEQNQCPCCILHEYGIPHHDTYAALKTASGYGCEFCQLIRHSLIEQECGNDISKEEAKWDFNPVFIVPWKHKAPSPRKNEPPFLEIRVESRPTCKDFISLEFEAAAPRDKIPTNAHGLVFKTIHADSAEPSCLEQAAEWLQTCLKRHPRCASVKRRKMRPPSRIIDVAPDTESQNPRLCLENENVHSWVALSYCWGGQSEFVLNKKTVDYLTRGVPLSDFPATLRDAVVITRNLGIRHLWIDALCIQQDSEDDWRRECSRMRNVYKGATLTLIGANSPSVDTGIFSKRTSQYGLCQLPWTMPNYGGIESSCHRESVSLRPTIWNKEKETWPIQQRGWTLQEYLLSSRTLSYSKGGMVWQCFTSQVDEGGRIHDADVLTDKDILTDIMEVNESRSSSRVLRTVPRLVKVMYAKIKPLGASRRRADSRWTTLVREYTSRNITKETDVLPAIAGLASEFARRFRDTYCAGLWRQELLVGLTWSLDPLSASKTKVSITSTAEYRAPSWTWASIKGAIRLEPPGYTSYRAMNQVHEQAKVVAVHIEPLASTNPFGQVKSAHLILQGRFYYVDDFLESGSTIALNLFPAAQKFLQAAILLPPGMKQEFSQQHRPCERQHFALLQLFAYTGFGKEIADYLVLESTTPDASAYRRVGCIVLANKAGGVGWSKTSAEHDPLEFRSAEPGSTGNEEFQKLAEDAFRELQKANVVEKKVTII